MQSAIDLSQLSVMAAGLESVRRQRGNPIFAGARGSRTVYYVGRLAMEPHGGRFMLVDRMWSALHAAWTVADLAFGVISTLGLRCCCWERCCSFQMQ